MSTDSVLLPAGTYVVGDPCYVIPDELWSDWLDDAGINNMTMPDPMSAPIDGHLIVAVGTTYGDGTYYDQNRAAYGVDAGLIGAVRLSVADTVNGNLREDLNHVVEFPEPFTIYRDDEGVIHVGHILIDTDPSYDEDDDCDGDCDDDHDTDTDEDDK